MFSLFRIPSTCSEDGRDLAGTAPSPSAGRALNTSSKKVSYLRSRSLGETRPLCKFGVDCYRGNPDHLQAEAHPWDQDYLDCCRSCGKEPHIISIRRLFEWADEQRSGKVNQSDLERVWPMIQSLGSDVNAWDSSIWEQLDDDGNGYINFSEFADAAQKFRVELPLGVEELVGECTEAKLCCGVIDCGCKEFRPRRRRCRFGKSCYQRKPEHRQSFCHPDESDWEDSREVSDPNMCRCGHKKKLHASALTGGRAVKPPVYWVSKPNGDDEFQKLVPIVEPGLISRFQDLFDDTYSDVTTRDRANHNSGDWKVPRNFKVISAARNENSKLWRKYTIRKAEQQRERELVDKHPQETLDLPPFVEYKDVLTTSLWESTGVDVDRLDTSINEWYLWHGTSASAAREICENDFKMRLAGTSTGTLYGRGSYFAESITKADEYSRIEGDIYTVLLCRVLGGRVRYCAERTPDAGLLTQECVEGPYDSILGDRKKVSNTYREFIIFDTEDVYPEYVITYRRGELFKSPSHP